jgi:crossover junction endodeoxyribonuclease RuvC
MSEAADRVILGIDPGTASTGYGVVSMSGNRLRMVEYGVIATPSTLPLAERLKSLFSQIVDVLDRLRPDSAAVESLFFNANVTSALAVGHARGVALLACSQVDCSVFEYTPQQVKMAVVGYGNATKEQVTEMVRALLALGEAPRPDHAADALGVAICHAHCCGIREKVAKATGAADQGRKR